MSGLRERQKRGRQERMIESARRLFIEKGYPSVSLEMIAEEAELSKVTIYNYYKTKGRLLLGIVNADLNLLLEKIDAIVSDAGDDLLEALLAFSRTFFDHALSQMDSATWRHVLVASIAEGNTEFGKSYAAMDRQLEKALERLLERFKAKGVIGETCDCEAASFVLLSIANTQFTYYVSNDEATLDDSLAAVFREMTFMVNLMTRKAER